jgi:cytoskeletal protein RodZ
MNKNQKIALGCGVAGCLGLIVVAIAGVLIWFLATRSPNTNRNSNSNTNSNRSTNRNSAANDNTESTSSSSMSDDNKHKLFQAATVSGDSELLQRVLKKLGLFTAAGSPTEEYTELAKNHFAWALRNTDFIKSVSTPETARAYVEEHIND